MRTEEEVLEVEAGAAITRGIVSCCGLPKEGVEETHRTMQGEWPVSSVDGSDLGAIASTCASRRVSE